MAKTHAKQTVTKSTGSGSKQQTNNASQTHYDAIVSQCSRLDQQDPPYVFGGGHGGFSYNPASMDCSAAVSLVLHLAGYDLGAPMDSTAFMTWGDPGPGQVTIWANADHVFLQFANKCWAWSCSGCVNGWQSHDNYGNPPNGYVARHPSDLGGPAGQVIGGNTASGAGSDGTFSLAGVATTSKAAALSTFLELPGFLDSAESVALTGERSLMNDQPLLPFIEQMTQGSLRNFQSAPNGNFFAFIPDYFGGLGVRTPYWEINDIEIMDGQIDISDDALATHVYVVGDTGSIDGQIDVLEKIQTAGVVTIFNAFMADFLNGQNAPLQGSKEAKNQYQAALSKIPTLAEKSNALAFLQKYGARPYYEEAPMIRSHFFEMFLAFQTFCLLWSKQFQSQFEFTFMPELFPGGLVRLPQYGIQCYIDEVTHEGSYTDGFTTRALLSAPTSLPNGRGNIHEGMVRAGILSPSKETIQSKNARS